MLSNCELAFVSVHSEFEKPIWFFSDFQTCYNQLLTFLLPWMRSLTCHLQIMMFNVCSEVSFEFKFHVVLFFNKG